MKNIFTLFILFLFTYNLSAQSTHSKVKIMLAETELQQIAELGIDITEGEYRKGVYFTTDLSKREITSLENANIQHSILVEDVSDFYSQRAEADRPIGDQRDLNDKWPVPENWEHGSMGGFYTLDEVMAELDDMATLYPELISPRYIVSEDTLTHEGRYMYWVRLSDNPEVDEDEPEILYSGVHHAREPMSVQQMIYYMWYILENYDTNPDIQILVQNTEMYFVPIVNPDGYAWNYNTNPNGGGMWRKNRSNNGDGTMGVDPNRNYGYQWGYDNSGSSPYSSDETYRGPSAFSEPETKNMRDFSIAHDFRIALNYHSYSNLLLYAWGWTSTPSPDNDIFHSHASLMTVENGYTIGPASTTIYPTNGDSNDWMYGEQESKDKIFAYVPEVGGDSDGFWPSTSRIIPLCQENMLQNITAARLVGKYASIDENSPMIIDYVDGYIIYEINRLGLTDAEEFTVTLTAIDDVITSVGDADSFLNMELMQSEIDSISFELNANIESGTEFRFLLSVDNGLYTISDTITKIFGTPVPVFSDPGETIEYWTSSKWEVTNEDSYSLENSITDSKNADYENDENSSIVLISSIDLTDVSVAFVNFWAKWDIEPAYDFVQFMVKKESENNWTAVSGKYTKKGANEYLDGNEPYFDGTTDWVNEEINISAFAGEPVSFKFVLESDSYVEEDGFYFDDFLVSVVSTATSLNENSKNSIFVSNAYPNPTNGQFSIDFSSGLNNSQGELQLFNSFGNMVKSKTIDESNGIINIDVNGLADGIYYYSISFSGQQSEIKKLIKISR